MYKYWRRTDPADRRCDRRTDRHDKGALGFQVLKNWNKFRELLILVCPYVFGSISVGTDRTKMVIEEKYPWIEGRPINFSNPVAGQHTHTHIVTYCIENRWNSIFVTTDLPPLYKTVKEKSVGNNVIYTVVRLYCKLGYRYI